MSRRFDFNRRQFFPNPIDLGPEGEQVFLLLFGTGIRGRAALANVAVTIGVVNSVNAPVSFAGAQGGFVGLDQVNALLPRALIGRGEVDLVLTADGKPSNAVRISIR